jgi:quercetin dioxygenase-like cupin family protein
MSRFSGVSGGSRNDDAGSSRRTVVDEATSGKRALAQIFELGQVALKAMAAEARGGLLAPRWLHLGQAEIGADGATLRCLVAAAEQEYPLELKGPFEGTETIAGAVWSGRELLGPERNDGIAKLRFGRGTLDLPMHVHAHSDRFIVVLEGEGFFHVSHEPFEGFTAREIRSIPVKALDVLIFLRGLVHTFSAPSQDLLLLSHHSPLIPFDDPRQYRVPRVHWCPRAIS